MPSTSTSTDDHFLRRWFQVLAKRVFLSSRHAGESHHVRVEASETSDWWIQVQPPPTERCLACGHFATHEAPRTTDLEKQLRELRETLVLLTMYARLDYDSWLRELRETSGLRFHHQGILDPRFSFVVGDNGAEGGIHPCELLADTLGTASHQYSGKFKASYEQLKARAQTLEIPLSSLRAPIALRIELSQLGTAAKDNFEQLSSMVNAVTGLLQPKSEETSALPSFQLDSINLRLRAYALGATTLTAVSRIVDTGVRIGHLELPRRLEDPSVDQEELQRSWSSLACSLFRPRDPGPSANSPQIDHLELPPVYFSTNLAASWLLHLTTASNVRSLTIDVGIANSNASLLSATSIAWVFLSYAMFSVDSSNSVESLHLSGLSNIETQIVASVGGVAASQTPLIALCRTAEAHPRSVDMNDSIYMFHEAIRRSQSPNSSSNKLRRLVLSVSKNFATSSHPDNVVPLITQVLRGAGTRLTDLAVDGAQIDDDALDRCLELCPSLESLRLNGASLQSFDSLRLPNLSSIDLRSIRTSQEATLAYFESLKDGDSANTRTLERLRIGRGWSGHTNALQPEMLDGVLAVNKMITYLHVFRPNDPFSQTPSTLWTRLKNHDGKLISSRDRPLALSCKVSFLATARQFAEKTQMAPLNHDVITQIFQFAATPRQRTVVIESDLESTLY